MNESKAVFNYSHWTLLWVILFVYAIETSAFAVFFGQLFKRRKIDSCIFQLVSLLIFQLYWPNYSVQLFGSLPSLTFTLWHPLVSNIFSVCFRTRVFCFAFKFYNNTSDEAVCSMASRISEQKFFILLADVATLQQLYTNIFDYPFYIGFCLLLMLVYSVIYLLLAVYVERLNPGEFGVSQPWNYLCKRSRRQSSRVRNQNRDIENGYAEAGNGSSHKNHWLELSRSDRHKNPAMSIDCLNKVVHPFLWNRR